MHKNLACQLLAVPPSADKAQIKSAYIKHINLAEDAIDDALDVTAENTAWQHYQQLQKARSLLLKVIDSPAAEVPKPDIAPQQLSVASALPLTIENAYALLGLTASATQEQVQQAYQQQLQQLDSAIDQVSSPDEAEPLWEQHKTIQQARYLLLHTRVPVSEKTYSKKIVHACALLGVNADSSEQQLRQCYSEKIRMVEDQIDAAVNLQQEELFWDQHRQLQRAFAICIAEQLEESPEQTEQPPTVFSPHKGEDKGGGASLDDFLQQQKRQKMYALIFRLLMLCLLLLITYFAWQKGYLQQAKDWLLPPLSAEQLAVQAPVLELQEEVQQIRLQLEGDYDALRVKALDAAHADSADYPKRVRLRNRFDQQILQSPAFAKAQRQQAEASVSVEQQDYIAAEAPLLSARETYHTLQSVGQALAQGKPAARVKRRIPAAPKITTKPPTKKQQTGLPSLNAAQRLIMPRLIDVPEGQFMMGDDAIDDAQPVHSVSLPAFKMGESELSVKHFRQFVQQTKYQTEAERNIDEQGCSTFSEDSKSWAWRAGSSWKNPGFEQGEEDPVVCVSWADVQAYLNWLRGATGWNVRLASEAEWEYAARAGTTSKWFWGDKLSLERANCEDCNQDWEVRQTFMSRAYPANAFGLHSMSGNVWEWLQDCWQDNYKGAPDNGQARLDGNCAKRVMRGGSWYSSAKDLRSAARNVSNRLTYRSSSLGFRVVVGGR